MSPTSSQAGADTVATVFFCHGSRDPDWRAPFDLLVREYQRRFPLQQVRLAFLELMAPCLPDVLDELAACGIAAIQVFPLFLAPGAHTRRDLPALVAQCLQRWPALRVEIGPTLLESEATRAAVVNAVYPAISADGPS